MTDNLHADALAQRDNGEGEVDGLQHSGNPLRLVGARLAMLRSQRGWSIDDVVVRLKVRAAKLNALEAGDLKQLPDITFAIGVVRSYAKILGVDPVPLIDMLRRMSKPVGQTLTLPSLCGADLPRRMAVSRSARKRRRIWAWGIGISALMAAAFALYQYSNRKPVSAVRWKEPAQTGQNANPSAISGVAGAGKVAGWAKAPVLAPTAKPSAGIDSLSSQETNRIPQQTPQQQALLTPTVSKRAATAEQPAAASDSNTELIFKMSQDSWINVHENGGKQVFSGMVKAGTEQRMQGVVPFNVIVGNQLGLAAVEVDGKTVDPSKYALAKRDVTHFTLP